MQDYITYKNSKVAFSEYGEGSVIVLLHGFLEDSTMWGFMKNEFKNHKIITVDLLGHGNSECLGYIHTMEEMAEAVQKVLLHLNIDKVTVIGHSMGGYVALALADKYPEIIQKLCLMNSTSQSDSEERKRLRGRAVEMAKTNYKALVNMSVGNLFAKEINEIFANEISEVKKVALKTSVQGYIACSQGMKLRPNREIVLNGITSKLLIISEKDPVIESKTLIEEAQRTATPYVILSNGHMSYIEDKENLIKNIKLFV